MNEIERAIEYAEGSIVPLGNGHDDCPECNAWRTALIALREKAEREKGCEICNGGLPCDNECDGFCDICDIPEVWKTIHKTGQYNFCPMCGRKLKPIGGIA